MVLPSALSSLATCASPAGAAAPASKIATTSADNTVSSTFLTMLVITPSSGATISRTTLSVSTSAKSWSRLTASPSATCHSTIVPSWTDSGNTGALISAIINSFKFINQKCVILKYEMVLAKTRAALWLMNITSRLQLSRPMLQQLKLFVVRRAVLVSLSQVQRRQDAPKVE